MKNHHRLKFAGEVTDRRRHSSLGQCHTQFYRHRPSSTAKIRLRIVGRTHREFGSIFAVYENVI